MTVAEMRTILNNLPGDMEVVVVDNSLGLSYRGDIALELCQTSGPGQLTTQLEINVSFCQE